MTGLDLANGKEPLPPIPQGKAAPKQEPKNGKAYQVGVCMRAYIRSVSLVYIKGDIYFYKYMEPMGIIFDIA